MATKEMAREKGQAGYEGLPIGTIAFYGPDNRRATKVAVCIIHDAQFEPGWGPYGSRLSRTRWQGIRTHLMSRFSHPVSFNERHIKHALDRIDEFSRQRSAAGAEKT